MERWKRWVFVDMICVALSVAHGLYWLVPLWMVGAVVELACVRRGIP